MSHLVSAKKIMFFLFIFKIWVTPYYIIGRKTGEAAEKVSDFQNCHCKKVQSVSKLTIAEDRSTVGCG